MNVAWGRDSEDEFLPLAFSDGCRLRKASRSAVTAWLVYLYAKRRSINSCLVTAKFFATSARMPWTVPSLIGLWFGIVMRCSVPV
jgi:hypothetical protein